MLPAGSPLKDGYGFEVTTVYFFLLIPACQKNEKHQENTVLEGWFGGGVFFNFLDFFFLGLFLLGDVLAFYIVYWM